MKKHTSIVAEDLRQTEEILVPEKKSESASSQRAKKKEISDGKTKHALSYDQTMQRLRQRDKKLKIVRITLTVLLILSEILFVLFFDTMAAFGWIANAQAGENWPEYFINYGYLMLLGAALMTAGTVLCLCRCNRIAIAVATPGIFICMILMQVVVNYADEAGFYSTIRNMSAGAVYRDAVFPTVFVYVFLVALALMQHFSASAVQKRIQKKMQENAPAPKIIP